MAILDKLVWQSEFRLNEDLSLRQLADQCAVSIYHMSRVFRLATGISPMTYVRARMLSKAAHAIAYHDSSILTIALDCGYGSHEAFTRAFANYFGVLPSTVRKARSTLSLSLLEPLKMNEDMIVDVAKHIVQERPAFRVVGLSAICTFESISAIPPLWHAFNSRTDEIASADKRAAYGVCCEADESGRFRYLAGFEASEKTPGMDFIDLPTSRYAVFTHSGHISDLPKTVYTIWNKSLPDAGIAPEKSPDFELMMAGLIPILAVEPLKSGSPSPETNNPSGNRSGHPET